MNTDQNPTLTLSTGPDETVGQVFGRYKLLEKLGEGGFGAVWLAEQKEPVRRKVALKLIKLGMDTKAVVARFEAERQALAMMDHPNIAKVLDAGVTDSGRPYFVMELVRGIKITEYCDQNYVPTRERLDLFIKVCQAIQHAHQKGIIHRDIKPSNILVTLHDGVPVPKVIDFGIAKATQGELTDKTIHTQFQQFIGTPAYMSPEQAEMSGLDIDTRSDIYSVGVLLYELLTGRTPFDANELMSRGIDAMRKTIREKEPVRPSTKLATLSHEDRTTTAKQHAADVPALIHILKGDLDWITMKCLEKDRTRRYESANGLAMDIKRHLNNEPVIACPPTASYRLQKAFRRNKLAFISAAFVSLALLIGLVLSAWSLRRERVARLSEQEQRKSAQLAQADATAQRQVAQERLLESLVREMASITTLRELGYGKELRARVHQALELPQSRGRLDEIRALFTQGLGDPIGRDPVVVDWESGRNSRLEQIALSPDGEWAAMWGTHSNTLEILESSTGRHLGRFPIHRLSSLCFSADGRSVFGVAGGDFPDADERSLQPTLAEWRRNMDGSWARRARSEPVFALAATPLGVIAARIAANGRFEAFNLETHARYGTLEATPLIRQGTPAAFAPTLGLVALGADPNWGGNAAAIHVLSLQDPARTMRLETLPGIGRLFAARFSSDERLLLCNGENGALIYETSTFRMVGYLRGYLGESSGGAFLENGSTIAFAQGQRPGVRLLSIDTGTEIRLKTRGVIFSLASSMDGTTLMAAGNGGISLLRLGATPERRHLRGHAGGVACIEFSPDGTLIASTGKDGSVRLWENVSGALQRAIIRSNAVGQSVNFSSDGKLLVVGDYENPNLELFSVKSGEQVASAKALLRDSARTWTCAFTPDNRNLIAVGGGVRVWDLSSTNTSAGPMMRAQLLTNGYARNIGSTRDLQIDRSGKWCVFSRRHISLGMRPRVVVQPLALSEPAAVLPLPLADGTVQCIGIVPGREEVAYLTDGQNTRLLQFVNIATGEMVREMPLLMPGEYATTYISNFRFSPDGQRLAAASADGRRVNLYETSSGRRLYSLPGDDAVIWWLAWHPDGRTLAVAREDGDISVWNLPQVEAALAGVGLGF